MCGATVMSSALCSPQTALRGVPLASEGNERPNSHSESGGDGAGVGTVTLLKAEHERREVAERWSDRQLCLMMVEVRARKPTTSPNMPGASLATWLRVVRVRPRVIACLVRFLR